MNTITVSQLNCIAKQLLENHLGMVCIIGEISNFVVASSGHIYFSLKDNNAQIRCAFFKGFNSKLKFKPEDGQEVIVHAKLSIFEARGDYQLIVQKMALSGVGRLWQQYEASKKKLAKAGLFLEEHKKTLPKYPVTVGVISSAHGAVIHDILHVLNAICPYIKVLLYPCKVQGVQATESIIKAIDIANRHKQAKILILARGGGSLEDLWGFNQESLAYAIFNSKLPIVSAVGHETDVTIADFVADVRSPTPTAAAQQVAFSLSDYIEKIISLVYELEEAMLNKIASCAQNLDQLSTKIISPKETLTLQKEHLRALATRLIYYLKNSLQTKQHNLSSLANRLDALSPLNTFKRGFSMVTDLDSNIINSATQLKQQQEIITKFQDGQILSKILSINT